MEKKYVRLSKYLSYILRHNPASARITLDERGFADLDRVMEALESTRHRWAGKEAIEKLIAESEKQRFEIVKGKIRALYGHSVAVKVCRTYDPSGNLYHGTSPKALNTIREEGLKPMGRQFVHLSKTIDDAVTVGKRHHPHPVILIIDAVRASHDISFYERGDVVLAKEIPPGYIEIAE